MKSWRSWKRWLVTAVVLGVCGAVRGVDEGAWWDGEHGYEVTVPFAVYAEQGGAAEPAFVASGWMGDTEALDFNDGCREAPRDGSTCIRVCFSRPQSWAGLAWQHPANNWGDMVGGLNLSGARRLAFWARGAEGGEAVSFQMGLIGRDQAYCDSASAKLESIRLTREWHEYVIPLDRKDLKRIVTGFAFVVKTEDAPVTFYIDDIRYE